MFLSAKFAKCKLIFKILLLRDLAVNFEQSYNKTYIPPRLKRIATLPCEILMSENNSNNLKHVLSLTSDVL